MANDPKLSFDEFKLYYESTEKVTDRRLETNRWNYSVCIAILVAIATLITWSLRTAALIWIGFAAAGTLSTMAILFCILWFRQIGDFKNLNSAKFSVLNAMAPRIEFDFDKPGAIASFDPFSKEWKELEKLRGLTKAGKFKLLALKSSNMELFIPWAFLALFAGILLVLLTVIVVTGSWNGIVAPQPSTNLNPQHGDSH